MDISLFGRYADKGMLLLRNLMFKSCCFNCNLQEWFKDNGITEVGQLNGFTLATKIEDVKLITTPSSIKYLKFGTLEQWLQRLPMIFGIVKYDKKTHYMDGALVQTHYQLLNTLELNRDEVQKLLNQSLEYADKLRNDPAVVRYHIKYPDDTLLEDTEIHNKNDAVFHLFKINNDFTKTKYYHEFLNSLIIAFYKNLKRGHVLVNGNYSTLFGNPIEMLQFAIGQFDGTSQIGVGQIHSTRFEYGKTILGSRSPHVCAGNIWLTTNAPNETIDKYLNLTNEIVCVNSINENLLNKLSGSDFDSDTVMLTDNEILVRAAEKNYGVFKTPTSMVAANKTKRYYTPEQQADLDIKTSVNKIGEIVNLSQVLNSIYWDNIHHGKTHEEMFPLYCDIVTLDIMSGIEIDKAKKEFEVDTTRELRRLKDKYADQLIADDGRKNLPHFFSHIDRLKGYYDKEKRDYSKYDTTMDYLQTVVNSYKTRQDRNKDKNDVPLAEILNRHWLDHRCIDEEKIDFFFEAINEFINLRSGVNSTTREPKEKRRLVDYYMDILLAKVSEEKLTYSTIYKILIEIDVEPYGVKNVALQILFEEYSRSFNKALAKAIEPTEYIEPGGTDLYLYGIGFTRYNAAAKVSTDLTK